MKPRASSDCSNGGSMATMSSTTTSLMGYRSCLACCFARDLGTSSLVSTTPSMQPRRLEQPRAVGGSQHHVECNALVVHGERHVHASSSERPEFPIKCCLACYL